MKSKTKPTSNNKMLIVAFTVTMFVLFSVIGPSAGIYYMIKNNSNFQKMYKELKAGSAFDTGNTQIVQDQLSYDKDTTQDQPTYAELKAAYDDLKTTNAELEKKILDLQPKTETKPAPTHATTQPAPTPAAPSCKRMKIYEGKFASDKCYSTQDYNDLSYYLSRYNSMVSQYNSAVSSMRITCNGSEFFEDDCKQDKKEKEDASDKMSEYESKIKSIMSRGK